MAGGAGSVTLVTFPDSVEVVPHTASVRTKNATSLHQVGLILSMKKIISRAKRATGTHNPRLGLLHICPHIFHTAVNATHPLRAAHQDMSHISEKHTCNSTFVQSLDYILALNGPVGEPSRFPQRVRILPSVICACVSWSAVTSSHF